MSKHAVEVKGVKKSFYLPNHKNDSLKRAITQVFKPKEKGGDTFNALNGISFTIEKGDFFGILGRNGSGKSTLLKMISEIYQPTAGSVSHDGKLVSFIELGVGFKAELSGRENVYLNGALLGFSRAEIDAMYDDIVSFAELEMFMDQKLKNYSSGMKVRLAFSVAIRAHADILVLDEVLAVGDASFQKKCTDYFETLKDDGKTVILVTHSMGNVRRFCNKAVVIDEGKVIYNGEAEGAADAYLDLFSSNNKEPAKPRNTKRVEIDSVAVETTKSEIEVKYKLASQEKVDGVKIAVDIRTEKGVLVAGVPGEYFNQNLITVDGTYEGRVVFENKLFDGNYSIYMRVRNVDDTEVFEDRDKATLFEIETNGAKSIIPADLFQADKSKL